MKVIDSLFKDIEQLSPTRHQHLGFRRSGSLARFSAEPLLPVYGFEFPLLVGQVPVAFLKTADAWELVAVCGLEPSKNAFITLEGRWQGAYLPEVINLHPFHFIAVEDGGIRLGLAAGSDRLLENEGQPLFDELGEPEPFLVQVSKRIKRRFVAAKRNKKAAEKFEEFALLERWLPPSAPLFEDREIYRIDPERLRSLDGDALQSLAESRLLEVAYAHLFSISHINRVRRLSQREQGPAGEPILEEQGDLGTGFNFD